MYLFPAPDKIQGMKVSGWLKAAMLVVATFLVANITLVVGKHTGRWDSSDFFAPYFTLIADHARHGELLLWTPLVEGGSPAGLDPEIGALSPLTVGVAALLGPHEAAFRAYWLAIWCLGGLGILVFARHLGAPQWAGCVGAIGYMFSAIYTGHAQHTAYLVVMSLLPWTLWRLDVAIRERRIGPAAEAGAIWGLAALSGYPALIIIGECYLGLWIVGRWIGACFGRTAPETDAAPSKGTVPFSSNENWDSPPRVSSKETVLISTDENGESPPPVAPGEVEPWYRQHGKILLAVVVFLAVSLVAMSPAYVGFLTEMRGYTERSGPLPRELAVNGEALDPKALMTFASPYLPWAGGGTNREEAIWRNDVSMCGLYLSPVVFVLGIAAVWLRPRDASRWFLAALTLVCLGSAMGDVLPLRGWLYDLLPPMRYFRYSAIFRCYYLFTVVVLAIFAAGDLTTSVRDDGRRQWRRLFGTALVAASAAAACFVAVCIMSPMAGKGPSTLFVAAAHAAAVWTLTAALAFLGRHGGPGWHERIAGRYLVGLVVADALLTAVLCKPTIATDRRKTWEAAEAAHVGSVDLTESGLARLAVTGPELQSPLNACLLAKLPVLDCYNVLRSRFHKRMLASPVLKESAVGDDRIWFSRQMSIEPFSKETYERLAARASILGRPCLVISDPQGAVAARGAMAPADWGGEDEASETVSTQTGTSGTLVLRGTVENLPAAERVRTTVLKYTGCELLLEVDCPSGGWLLVTDRWAPGWRVSVNGQQRELWIGNLIFRAVAVERGVNQLHFVYCPFGYPWLLAASWATLGLVLASAGLHWKHVRSSATLKEQPT
jgi:hypothetical protein